MGPWTGLLGIGGLGIARGLALLRISICIGVCNDRVHHVLATAGGETMTDDGLTGPWWGVLLVGGQRRAIALDVRPAATGHQATWSMGTAGDIAVEIRQMADGVTITSRQIDLVHRGPVSDELTGHVVSHQGVDTRGITFRLRRDPKA